MNKHFHFAGQHRQSGQTAVLFALMIIGLVAFVGLAVDGGSVFNGRRVAQNAVDGAAMAGAHYMVGSDAPTETRLQEVVNGIVQANGIPDTDGDPKNHINDNVTINYTDRSGDRLNDCNPVGSCGYIPDYAFGLKVVVDHEVPTYFLGVINRESLGVGAEAVAIISGGTGGGDVGDNVLHAFGACEKADKPLDISSHYVDFIGGVHSDTYFENRGGDEGGTEPGETSNHYHGQVTYGQGYEAILTEPAVYEPEPPQPITTTPGTDPLGYLNLTVDDFKCVDGRFGTADGVMCHDLATPASAEADGVIDSKLLKEQFLLDEDDEGNWQLEPGLYYGGNHPFSFGEPGMRGQITLVTSQTIKLTENDLYLESYFSHDLAVDGLLFYSTYNPGDPCGNFPFVTPAIDTTGDAEEASLTEGSFAPAVNHDGEGCVDFENPSACSRPGSLYYSGLIYAPHGRVAASGHASTYDGAIIAPSIRINGYLHSTDFDPPEPVRKELADGYDRVGALFRLNPNLFPPSQVYVSLDE